MTSPGDLAGRALAGLRPPNRPRPTPPPVRTVPQLLAWRAGADLDRVAVEVDGPGARTLTFHEWHTRARAAAAALASRGVRRGDRVGLVFGADGWIEFAVTYAATHLAGAAAVPLSDRLTGVQLEFALEHCEATAVVHGRGVEGAALARWRPVTLEELTTTGPDVSTVDAVEVGPTDVAQILYTSGTTGRPKGVVATHANLVQGFIADPRRLALAHSDRFLHAFPIGTNAAQTMLLGALTSRPACLCLTQFTPLRFARLIESSRAGTIFVVPTIAIELLNSGALAGRDTTAVRLVGSTAAPLPPAVAERLAAAFPQATIVNYYTSTEAAPAQTSMIFDPGRRDAVGRAVGGQVMVTDDSGQALPPGRTGQVWLRAEHPRSYFRDEAASAATFRGHWVRTGDVGRIDPEGYLYLLDRDVDIVKSGAFKVSTVEVEAALYEHPLVAEAAVVGVPHPVLGSALAAVVVSRPGADEPPMTLPELRRFLAGRLADHQLPARLALVDHLPRNEAGKVLKRELVGWLTEPPDRVDVAEDAQ